MKIFDYFDDQLKIEENRTYRMTCLWKIIENNVWITLRDDKLEFTPLWEQIKK